MKKWLLFLLLFWSATASAQICCSDTSTTATPPYNRTTDPRVLADKATWSKNFMAPPHSARPTIPDNVPDSLKDGAIARNTSSHRTQVFNFSTGLMEDVVTTALLADTLNHKIGRGDTTGNSNPITLSYFKLHSTTYNFNEGLTNISGNVGLGGSLSTDATINTNSHNFSLQDVTSDIFTTFSLGPSDIAFGAVNSNDSFNFANFFIDNFISPGDPTIRLQYARSGGNYQHFIGNTGITGVAEVINDGLYNMGIINGGDYEANFLPRSLVTKQYVDAAVAAGVGGSAIQNQHVRPQVSSNFWISGTGSFDGGGAHADLIGAGLFTKGYVANNSLGAYYYEINLSDSTGTNKYFAVNT
jgi:hypothetical protein